MRLPRLWLKVRLQERDTAGVESYIQHIIKRWDVIGIQRWRHWPRTEGIGGPYQTNETSDDKRRENDKPVWRIAHTVYRNTKWNHQNCSKKNRRLKKKSLLSKYHHRKSYYSFLRVVTPLFCLWNASSLTRLATQLSLAQAGTEGQLSQPTDFPSSWPLALNFALCNELLEVLTNFP